MTRAAPESKEWTFEPGADVPSAPPGYELLVEREGSELATYRTAPRSEREVAIRMPPESGKARLVGTAVALAAAAFGLLLMREGATLLLRLFAVSMTSLVLGGGFWLFWGRQDIVVRDGAVFRDAFPLRLVPARRLAAGSVASLCILEQRVARSSRTFWAVFAVDRDGRKHWLVTTGDAAGATWVAARVHRALALPRAE